MVLTLIALIVFQAWGRVNGGRKLTDLLSNQYDLIFQQTDVAIGWHACDTPGEKKRRFIADPGLIVVMGSPFR